MFYTNMEDAYVINLAHRTDRWELMKTNWSKYFNLIQVNGIILPKDDRHISRRASEGLGLTHIELLKDAKTRGLKTILILEDDAVPEPNWYERWIEIKEYLDAHLDEWETFNGCSHFLRHYFGVKELNQSVLIDGRVACASHFMYLNLEAFDRFMKWTDHKPDIDIFYCSNFKLYSAFPILSKQADGKSDIIDDNRDWDMTYLKNELDFRHNLGNIYFKYKNAVENKCSY